MRWALLVLYLVFTLLPIVWLFLSTIQTEASLLTVPPRIIPTDVTFRNYVDIFKPAAFGEASGQSTFLLALRNSVIVSLGTTAVALVFGSAILGVRVPLGAVAPIALATAVSALSCTGLGLVNAALGLRVREVAVLSNVIFGVLLIFCGVNVAVSDLPGWMQPISNGLPLTHGIEAARRLADGATLGGVAGLLGAELAIGGAYMALGYGMLRFFETMSRRHATLERA